VGKWGLSEADLRFRQEVESLVLRWAGGEDEEYVRLWKRLGSWSMGRTEGDVVKKAALKKRLMETNGGQCQDCNRTFAAEELQMHRLDTRLRFDHASNFGYTEANVALICAVCHRGREESRVAAEPPADAAP
jgi:hypothetical protein